MKRHPTTAFGALAVLFGSALSPLVVSAAPASGAMTPVAARAAAGFGNWDRSIQPIVDFVERERGLKFKNAVPVTLLSDKAFRKELDIDESKVTKEERDDLDESVRVMRALGLLSGKVDLLKETETLHGEAVAAFYDPEKKRIRVRGKRLNLLIRTTLAHELTHALQDQHFNLTKLEESLTDDEANSLTALVEGDASLVETAFIDNLSEADRAKYDRLEAEDASAFDPESVESVPEILQVFFSAPYVFGEPLVSALRATGGTKALNRAFRKPPTTEDQLLDPRRFLAKEPVRKVKTLKLRKGEKKLDAGTFGAFGLYLMLSARIDPKIALGAVDGWGGDQHLAYTNAKDQTCERVAIRGDTAQDTARLFDVLEQWAAAMPANTASAKRTSGLATFETCDPGPDVTFDVGDVQQASAIPVARTTIFAEFLQSGLPLEMAGCTAHKMAIGLDSEILAADVLTPEQEVMLGQRVQLWSQQCVLEQSGAGSRS